MKNQLISIFTIITLIFGSCNLPDFEGPDSWEFEFLGPIIINQTSLEDLAELEELIFNYELRSNEIDIPPGVSVIVPPIPPMPEFKAETFNLTDHFVWIHADSLIFDITITNRFPINIKAGTLLKFRNTINNEIVYEHEILEDIAPNEDYKFTDLLSDQFVESDIDFYIDGFHSDGSPDEPVIFDSETGADFEFVLSFIKLQSLKVRKDQNYTIEDTTEVFIEIDKDDEKIADGFIHVFISNLFPTYKEFQLYFLDENLNIKDSLFDLGRIKIEPAELNANTGSVNTASVIEGKHTINISAAKIRSIAVSEYIIPYFSVSTMHLNDDTRINAEESFMDIQITGDINLYIRFKE